MLDQENFPCGNSPEVREVMMKALPCAHCRSLNLIPASDCNTPPMVAVSCVNCGDIEGDAPTLAEAVVNWNARYPVS